MLLITHIILYYNIINLCSGLEYPHTLIKRNEKFSLNVFENLRNIPYDQVCVWSKPFNSYFPETLLHSLSSKVRFVYQTKTISRVPEPCLHNVVVLQHLTDLDQLFAPVSALSAQHSVYTVVTDNWPDVGPNVQSLLDQHTRQFDSARVFVVMLADGDVFSLSSPFFTYRRFLPAVMTAMGKPVDFGSVDLHGRTVNIATFNCSPFVMHEKIGTRSKSSNS